MTNKTATLMRLPLLLLWAMATLLAGCEPEPQSSLKTVKMQLGGKKFTLEVADRDDARQYGLMRRDSMPDDHGMIFVFQQEKPLGFYMKNTRIPLDIIYLDAAGKVVSIKQMQPMDETSVSSDGPAKYAIELNQGTAASLGIKAGMVLQMPGGLNAKD